MALIRPFQNSDLPGVFEVWMRHWHAAKHHPPVSVSILERAIMSRQFFDPQTLIVGLADGQVIAWAHWFADPKTSPDASGTQTHEALDEGVRGATIAAFCLADEPGLAICDQLLSEVEVGLRQRGIHQVRVGTVRDERNGYAGLAPIGHGIGIPVADARTNSMLSRHGYHVDRNFDRMVVHTSTYRPPVNRSFLQFRRSTRLDHLPVLPSGERTSAAMSHFDIERHILIDHRQQEPLAVCGLWMGDPEVQVMESSRAILSLRLLAATDFHGNPIHVDAAVVRSKELSEEQQFLITSMVQSLSNRQIFTVETSVDRSDTTLIEQLKQLKFECVEQGRQWLKVLS
ncbi:GNAT family N-acetyltransferase [Neorhodopirellula pilleata]|uniref:N-acetyltransferase domain-containing protein n=1 Tax=Neorhodopirellula pilleata TaxID=2714738 RepID=A0A5C5ZPR9_9BACT|nr:hypothetical protein [Neorhodopirellula pilleata]TWT89176.1 hypothetical protein Pla100_56430 [Neorhodopirellula pilleata]